MQLSFLELITVAAFHHGVLNLKTKDKGDLKGEVWNKEATGAQEQKLRTKN